MTEIAACFEPRGEVFPVAWLDVLLFLPPGNRTCSKRAFTSVHSALRVFCGRPSLTERIIVAQKLRPGFALELSG